jgi:hypothetical protein
MREVVYGPQPGAFFDLDSGRWLLPCAEPVVGIGHDGLPYCSWDLSLIDEPPLMYFDVVGGRVEGPFYDEEDSDDANGE